MDQNYTGALVSCIFIANILPRRQAITRDDDELALV